ncbi:predicted protein [Chaetoceros tenuissimus]|uniref:Uncharacterized protein n=1 Tax=Chaetoceros tenuissimus TaxID=426638 RepID=A0AAD3DCR4_9STRA|nr:predicted protein [Chaetoceros tenuissimus]
MRALVDYSFETSVKRAFRKVLLFYCASIGAEIRFSLCSTKSVFLHNSAVKALSSPTWHLKSLQLGSDFQGTDVHVDWHFDAKRNVVNNHELENNMASYDSLFASIIPPVSRDDAIVHKLTLLMMEKRSQKHYFKYVPKNKLNGKLCMVVSKAFFRINDRQNLSFEKIDFYNPRDSSHFTIHEVAFASYGSPEETMNVPVYLINLNEALLTPISFSEVKAINNAKKKLKDDHAKKMVWGVCSPCASKKIQFTSRSANNIVQDMQNKGQVLAFSHSLYFHDQYLHEILIDMLELKVDALLSSSNSSSPALALEKKFEEVKIYTMIPCTDVSYEAADGTFYADLWSSFTSNIQKEKRAWENNGQVSHFAPMMSPARQAQKKLDKFEFEHLQDLSTDFVEDLLEQWEHVGEKHIKKEHSWTYANASKWSK